MRAEISRRSGLWLAGVLLIITASLSALALKYLDAPYVWIAAVCTLALLTATSLTRRTLLKALWWNLAVVCIVLGAFEAYLYSQQAPARRDTIQDSAGDPQAMSEPHDVLGYAPVKNRSGVWTRYIGDDFVFRIEYTIDSRGMRISPPTNGAMDRPCVFFFGGSYTFGSGVNDAETYPYRAGVKAGGRYRTYNFAFRGYGPHQMLAALEDNGYEEDLQCQPRHVVYMMIPDHVRRAAGFTSWDRNGPRYVLDDDGEIVLAGRIGDGRRKTDGLVARLLGRSMIWRRILAFLAPKPDERSADLTSAIIERAGEIVSERHPDGAFHVIVWPSTQPLPAAVIDDLLSSGLEVHSIGDILADFESSREQYRLHPHDAHPNARAHGIIGDYIATEILKDQERSQ